MGLEFSIVVPSYGRPLRLAACLAALEQLDYSRDAFEVIVVDDGSVPPLPPYDGPLSLTLLRQENAGPAAARNAGAARARGKFLAFTDDDCAPAPTWLSALATALSRGPDSLVGGLTINALEKNSFAAASQSLVSYLYDYYNPNPAQATFFTSNNIALPVDRFHAFGGFDRHFRHAAGEDRLFCVQWKQRGWSMRFVPEAVVHHSHHLTLRTFWRQHLHYGRAAHRFHIERRARDGTPHRLEPWTFYRDLIRYPWSVGEPRPLRQSALLLLSQVANATGYFLERFAA